MKTSTESFTAPPAGSCDAVQWEISQALDERRPFSTAAREHLPTCPHCAAFAEAWGAEGGLVSLLDPAPALDPATAQRMMQASLAADAPAETVRPARATSAPLLRWAAVLALGALGWWLLDPKVAPPPSGPVARNAAASPTVAMSRQMARLEQPLVREQAALQGAAVDGLARVREVLDWSSGVLQ